ncbi:hypothetical protein HK097_001303 [Rhizophlyctis rosea]|uniref:Uncharacterized protein n=1 Tax=Rhizophlyctis rosea TaxID=64517 RepID=A0AAD5S6X0_9FUNG|nr:hypothetical protein HK097_001303 [Rhizophlyctis rosea]
MTLLITAMSGLTAGIVSALVTNPMDVIKTRVQTLKVGKEAWEGRTQWGMIKEVAKGLARTEGWKGFYRGVGARCVSVGPTSIMLIMTYDIVKRLSVIDKPS